ncbi:MAG: MFS transporter [Pseudomonadota bacterium]
MSNAEEEQWDTAYEIRAISLLALGFGLVGLDRFIILPLFPVIAEDLGLNYQDLGLIAGVLALTWGLAAIVTGSLSDRFGCRRVLVVTTILFSLLVGISGLATGLVMFLVIRGLMGFAEGGFLPASIVATFRAAKPSRRGLMVGIQQMSAPLVGLFLGPIIAVGLLRILPGWEWVFATVAIPGFIVAYFMWRIIRDSDDVEKPVEKPIEKPVEAAPKSSFWSALKYRNVIFCSLAMLGLLSCLHTLSAFMPNYLTDHIGLSIETMGIVLSALGAGGVLGMIFIPAMSDYLSRKLVVVISLVLGILALFALTQISTSAAAIAACFFVISAGISGVVAIIMGPIVNTSVPKAISATATGIVSGVGEMFGGAFAPAIAGGLAQAKGISVIPYISLIAAVFAIVVFVFGVREPSRDAQPG